MMLAHVPESSIVEQSVDGAPSCTSMTTRSAPSATSAAASALTDSTIAVDLDVGDPGGAHQRRQLLRDCTDEADLHVAELLDPGGGNRRLPGGAQLQVRRDVLPLGAALRVGLGVVGRHHTVDEIVVSLVELVVADRRDLEARRIERVDRRLVLLDERLERRSADQVARGGENRVRVRGAKLRLRRLRASRRRPGAFVENAAVEVVRGEDLDVGVRRVSGR